MKPRERYLACTAGENVSLLEAALWVAAEHDANAVPQRSLAQARDVEVSLRIRLPNASPVDSAQALLREMAALGFARDDDPSPKPRSALLHHVLERKKGQPLSLAMLALEYAKRLDIPLIGINFPGHFLLRATGADYFLDPCGGRRLYLPDCHALLRQQMGANATLNAQHLQPATPRQMLLRLSRNLRHLYWLADDPAAALIDANRVLELGEPHADDHLARAELYQRLGCPQAERYDLERALLLSEDESQRLILTARLGSFTQLNEALH